MSEMVPPAHQQDEVFFFFISVFSDHADLQASNFWQSEEILSIISGASKLIYLVYLTIGTFYYKEIHLQTSLLLTELLKNYCYMY